MTLQPSAILLENNHLNSYPESGRSFIKRIEAARENRALQLKKWEEYDSKMSRNENVTRSIGKRKSKRAVEFPTSYVLLEATLRDDYDEVLWLLKNGADPKLPKDDGLTPLHQACINDNIKLCDLLISYGADVNARDADHWTPLHAAANCGTLEMCRFLISKGADLLAINVDGSTPYDMADTDEISMLFHNEFKKRNITPEDLDNARSAPEKAMIDELMHMYNNGEDVNTLDSQGAAPIHIAAACGYQDATEVLMKMGVPADTLDADMWTPSQVAVCWGQVDVLEVLVAYGADLTLRTPDGQTAFTLCEQDDMHERVMEIWKNREQLQLAANSNGKLFPSRPLARRQSSSSVHRSSMREKSNLSRRAVMQEVQLASNQLNEIQSVEDMLSPMEPEKPYTSPKPMKNVVDETNRLNHDSPESHKTTDKHKFQRKIIIVRPPTSYEFGQNSPSKDHSREHKKSNRQEALSMSENDDSKILSSSTNHSSATEKKSSDTPIKKSPRLITITDSRNETRTTGNNKADRNSEDQFEQKNVKDLLASKSSEQSITSTFNTEPVTTDSSSTVGGCCQNCTIL